MRNYLLLFITFSLLGLKGYGQEKYSVIAEDGLIVRAQPQSSSPKLGKYFCGEPVELVIRTDVQMTLQTAKQTLYGYWYYVKSTTRVNHELSGYVFSAYLLKFHDSSIIGFMCEENEIVCSVPIFTPEFQMEIFNYKVESNYDKGDTIQLYEEVFHELGDKLLKVQPNGGIKGIEVYYTLIETLNDWGGEPNEQGIIPKWKGHESFQKLDVVNQWFYRIPVTEYNKVREATAKRMELKRSPNWDYVGEGWWVPIYLYEGVLVPYEISSGLLKIVITHNNNETTIQYVNIGFSYGC